MKQLFLFCVLFSLMFSAKAQLVVDNTTLTPAQLIQNVLLGSGVTVTNVTFNGAPANTINEQAGSFDGTASNVGFTDGLILGSGDVQVAVGPNNSGSSTLGGTGNLGTDPDLAAITPNQIYDQAILEFDFIPVGDSVSFRYVFASEEYNEYVCSSVNDAFGFFISGPGISGPFSNNAMNIAIIPGTTTPVSINTVNLGVAGSNGTANLCSAIDPNWASYNIYYAGTNTQNSVQYDGWTVILTAKAAVQCGETYHIKLAIGDAGDGAFDSGVFLEAGSLNSSGLGISVDTPFPNGIVIEGCGDGLFHAFHSDTTQVDTLFIAYGGNAIPGTDYVELPDTIIVGIGQTEVTFNIAGIIDNLPEGIDSLTIQITNTLGCNYQTVYFHDYQSMQLSVVDSINICTPGETALLNGTLSGGAAPFNYFWSSGAPAGDSVFVAPIQTTSYTLNVTDACSNIATAGPTVVYIQCPLIPSNVFSPNDDGVNDVFVVINTDDYPDAQIWIYNRWGELVYQKDGYRNDWNGTHYQNNKELAEGVYYYIVVPNSPKYIYQAEGNKDQQYTVNGSVTLVR
jgi:gliding motility-associated-like protein